MRWQRRHRPDRVLTTLLNRHGPQLLVGRKPCFRRDEFDRSMNLQALLVSSDDSAADVLGRVLSGYGIAVDRSSDPETTMERVQHQKFDALVVDFDDSKAAQEVLEQAKKVGSAPLSIALVADSTKVRQ